MANYTPNYQLHQWEPEDKFLRTDFNQDLSKIDTALDTLADKSTALEAAVALCGNCMIYTTQYVGSGGSGQSSPCTLTFPKVPLLVIISGGQEMILGAAGKKTGFIMLGGHLSHFISGSTKTWPTTWSSDCKTVSWYATNSDANGQFNAAGTTYTVIAFSVSANE